MPGVVYTKSEGDGPAFKFHWINVLVPITATISRVIADVAMGVDMIDDVLRAHDNWRRQQEDWHSRTLSDIEKL